MFKCQYCQKSSRKRFNIVQSGRSVQYTTVVIEHGKPTEPINSQGWEINQELAACSDCYSKQILKPAVMTKTTKYVQHVFVKAD